MADNDIFDRTVRKGWRNAARLLIGSEYDPVELRLAISALGLELKREGCPQFNEIVQIVADELSSAVPTSACDRLERVRQEQATSIVEMAVRSAKGLAVGRYSLPIGDDSQTAIGSAILCDIAVAILCPSELLNKLVVKNSVSPKTILRRCDHVRTMLNDAPQIQRLASMLLEDSTGASVKVPRIRRPKISQADILAYALTE